MNWDELKAQVDSAIKQEAIKVLDEAIARLQHLQTEYLDPLSPPAESVPSESPGRMTCAVCGIEVEPERKIRRHAYCADHVPPELVDFPSDPVEGTKDAPQACEVCGKPFTPRSPLSKTCSDRCRSERYRAYRIKYKAAHKAPAPPRVCAVCGKEFVPDDLRHRSITCSPECAKERIRQHDRARFGRAQPVTQPDARKPATPKVDIAPQPVAVRHCKTCGVQFMPTHHRQKNCRQHLTGTANRRHLQSLALTPEEEEWKKWAEQSRAKILERPDVVRMPKAS